jgi:hypothetical protein
MFHMFHLVPRKIGLVEPRKPALGLAFSVWFHWFH